MKIQSFDPELEVHLKKHVPKYIQLIHKYWGLPSAFLIFFIGIYSSWGYYNNPLWGSHNNFFIPFAVTLIVSVMVISILLRWFARDRVMEYTRKYYEMKS